jgi:hypothetical protein
MMLTEARDKLGAVLAPVADDDPDVLTTLVDSIEPPALMLSWGEPWLEPNTSCLRGARLVVTCVAARLSPGDGLATLEQLVDYVLDRLAADTAQWQLVNVSGPRAFTIAKTNYLAARVTLAVNVT